MGEREKQGYLKQIYYDAGSVGGFVGVKTLFDYVKKQGRHDISKEDVEEFLRRSEVHTTHVEKHKAKHWYQVVSPYPEYMLDVDSGFMDLGKGPYSKLIVAIDPFNRRAAARAVKDLKAQTVKQALMEILDEFPNVERIR